MLPSVKQIQVEFGRVAGLSDSFQNKTIQLGWGGDGRHLEFSVLTEAEFVSVFFAARPTFEARDVQGINVALEG